MSDLNKPNFKFAWEFFRDNYVASMGGMDYVDEKFLEDLECAFYTGAIVFMDQQATIVIAHQSGREEDVIKGQALMEELTAEIVGTYEEKSREEEEGLLADGLIDHRSLLPKGMVN